MTKPPLMDKRERRALGLGSDSTLDRLEARGLFPKRLTLAPGSRSVFWRRIEVEQWLRDRGVELEAGAEAAATPAPSGRAAKSRAASLSQAG